MGHRAFCYYFSLGVFASFLFSEGCMTPPKQAPTISQPIGSYHEVQKGETVWSIAKSYKLGVREIIEANKLPDPSKLTVGQLLFIPRRVPLGDYSGRLPSKRRLHEEGEI